MSETPKAKTIMVGNLRFMCGSFAVHHDIIFGLNHAGLPRILYAPRWSSERAKEIVDELNSLPDGSTAMVDLKVDNPTLMVHGKPTAISVNDNMFVPRTFSVQFDGVVYGTDVNGATRPVFVSNIEGMADRVGKIDSVACRVAADLNALPAGTIAIVERGRVWVRAGDDHE